MRRQSLCIALACPLVLAGCALPARPGRPGRHAVYLLLGEVHDNPAGHARRLAWLADLPPVARRAIVFEQFDRSAQPGIDAWRDANPRAHGPIAARALAEAARFDFRGWDFDAYRGPIVLAIARGWSILAGNLSASEARRTLGQSDGMPPPGWDPRAQQQLDAAVRAGHCGLLPESRVPVMAALQRARDMSMAQVMIRARARGADQVVLIAGNGHVQREYGVPRHLAAADAGASIFAVGFLEADDPPAANRFDFVESVDPFERGDPCAVLRERFAPARR